MKRIILFVLLFFAAITYSQNVPHLFELRGLEDSLGNTHLYYRYVYPSTSCWSKNIYHLDVTIGSDTFFIYDAASDPIGEGCRGQYIYDYEFFDNDPAKYIYGGYDFYIDPVALLIRYDGQIQINSFGGITNIEISNQNDSLVYAALGEGLYKSIDGGYNFAFLDSMMFIDNSMISLSRNDDSQIYGIDQNILVRSEDEGYSYIIVDDDLHWSWNYERELYYDADGQHIYGVAASSNESALLISDDNGNPFTWNLKPTTPGKIWFTLDEQIPGEVYYSYSKNIYRSTDFGNSFFLYKQLEQKITGLYKKSNTDILYASTLFRIYEITPDTINIIKNLPIPDEVFDWYPLQIGNKWIYHNTFYDDVGDSTRWISISEVVSQKIIENQVYQEVLVKEIPIDSSGNSGTHYEYFRVDSANGRIFRDWFENDTLQLEELYMDLIAEVGDTILVGNGIYLESEEPVTIFGLNSTKRTFLNVLTPLQHLELVNGFGKTYEYIWELVGVENILKGCIIDGVVYGDTTVVSVDDETPNLPTEFSLSQNYPNPFNPTTKIKFTIPQSIILSDAKNLIYVQLKVYDILGNEIATLVNEEKSPGVYEVEFDGTGLPSGIYSYQLHAGSFVQTKKMILLK
jgi:Secretion system C-terminal sorting domain